VVLPSETIGFDGIPRGGILKPNQILLAQGVQEDELHARYRAFRIIVYAIGFFSIVFNLMIAVHENLLEAKREQLKS